MLRTAWNPWSDMQRLQSEMNRRFPPRGGAVFRAAESPLVDVAQNEQGLLLTAELPGVDPATLELTVTSDTVTIAGRSQVPETVEGAAWARRERSLEPFSRTVELPVEVDPDRTEATCANGVLVLKLLRPVHHAPRKVTIKAG